MTWADYPVEPRVGPNIHKPPENPQKLMKTHMGVAKRPQQRTCGSRSTHSNAHGRREAPTALLKAECDFGLLLLTFLGSCIKPT